MEEVCKKLKKKLYNKIKSFLDKKTKKTKQTRMHFLKTENKTENV